MIFTKACYHRLDETEPSGENDLLPGTLTRPCKKGQHVHGLHFDDSLLFSTLVCLHHLQDICPNKSKIPQNSWVCLTTEDLINYVEQALRLKRKALLESEDDLLLTWFLLTGPDFFWGEVFKAAKIPLDWNPPVSSKKRNRLQRLDDCRVGEVSSHGEWCSAYGWCTSTTRDSHGAWAPFQINHGQRCVSWPLKCVSWPFIFCLGGRTIHDFFCVYSSPSVLGDEKQQDKSWACWDRRFVNWIWWIYFTYWWHIYWEV